ncbi:hypothetical protein [Vibrio aestuarianus]|uniref:Lipoprotein n=1 Tax=Vibrio aestuarianus TaxID=28171 RepID=A0A9X4ESF3_9VIBR|nr:hypothetical protein [Vibrio aestuarianus]MDE1240651.1 hypothetical protein [Vibrio aestuarianus]
MTINASYSFVILSSAALLSACSTPVKDTTPIHPTTVVKAKYSMTGLYLPDGQGSQTTYTRPSMRHIQSDFKTDSFLSSFASFNRSDIYKLDRNLMWEIDHASETYRECPLEGCLSFSFADQLGQQDQEGDKGEDAPSYEEMSCSVTLKKNEFEVKPTGKTRIISGMHTNEYSVTWHVIFEDNKQKTDQNLLRFSVWTTTPNSDIKQAWKIHSQATDNYLNAVGDNNPLVRILGRDGYKAISAFSGDIENTSPNSTNPIFKKLQAVKGYPLSLKMEFFQQSQACQEEKSQASTSQLDFSNGVDGLTESATGLVGDLFNKTVDEKVREWQKDALIRYVYEVTSVDEEGIRDSKFEVPANYRLSDRQ